MVLYSLLVWRTPDAVWDALLVFDEPDSAWDESLKRMGVSTGNRLKFPILPAENIGAAHLAAALRSHVQGYHKIYLPDATSEGFGAVIATAIAMTGIPNIVTRTTNGPPDEIAIATSSDWDRMISHLNALYGSLIRNGRLKVLDLNPVHCYRNVVATDLQRYWNESTNCNRRANSDDEDPWDLLSSDYEQRRHAVELKVISELSWNDMVEVGSCVGAFTQLVLQKFPDRRITAIEPVREFATKLARRTENRVRIIATTAQAVDEAFDLVLLSSSTYYMSVWPFDLVKRARRFVVTSNETEYEEHTVVPAMQSSGWKRTSAQLIEPCFEDFCRFTLKKHGSTISTWSRS